VSKFPAIYANGIHAQERIPRIKLSIKVAFWRVSFAAPSTAKAGLKQQNVKSPMKISVLMRVVFFMSG
jgi:hypothetical protein